MVTRIVLVILLTLTIVVPGKLWNYIPESKCYGPQRYDVVCPIGCCCRLLMNPLEIREAKCRNGDFHEFPKNLPPDVTTIDVSHNNISKITKNDLKGFKHLKLLDLGYGDLRSIDEDAFVDLGNLYSLTLSENPNLSGLTRNTFTHLKNLTKLYLENVPRVFERDLGLLSELENLELVLLDRSTLRHLTDEIFAGNKKLKDVIYRGVPNEIDLQKSTADLTLNLSWERWIRYLYLPIKMRANHLRIDYPRISSLRLYRRHLECFRNVSKLSISVRNTQFIYSIQRTTFFSIRHIGILDLSYSNMRYLVQDLFQSLANSKIDRILLRRSSIELGELEGSYFASLQNTSLKELDLSGNTITRIKNDAFVHLPELEVLKIDGSRVALIDCCAFRNLPHLTDVYLGYNKLVEINLPSILKSCPDLKTLNVNKNKLEFKESIKLVHSKLEFLDISYNTLQTIIDFENLPNLQVLHASNLALGNRVVSLRSILINGLRKLEIIDLNNNKISIGNNDVGYFKGVINLIELDLSGNNIVDSEPSALEKVVSELPKTLEKLNLRTNGLIEIPVFMFKNLKNLRFLDLSDNKIKTIPDRVFNGMNKLMSISLKENVLPTIRQDSGLSELQNLRWLDVREMMFNCDCGLRWFRDWVNETTTVYVDGADQKCAFPAKFENFTISEFKIQWLKCDHNFEKLIGGICAGLILINIAIFVCIFIHRVDIIFWWRVTRFWNRGDVITDFADDSFDAFVSYNSKDAFFATGFLIQNLEKSSDLNFKLCIDGRDFIVGEFISVNIANMIEKSRWVILVVSKHFLSSEWCKYETRMAEIKCFDERKNVIILVFLEDIENSSLPKGIVLLRKHCHCLQWPKREKEKPRFWKKLKLILIGSRNLREKKEDSKPTERDVVNVEEAANVVEIVENIEINRVEPNVEIIESSVRNDRRLVTDCNNIGYDIDINEMDTIDIRF